jgi:hypothetical protein
MGFWDKHLGMLCCTVLDILDKLTPGQGLGLRTSSRFLYIILLTSAFMLHISSLIPFIPFIPYSPYSRQSGEPLLVLLPPSRRGILSSSTLSYIFL